MRAEVMEYYRLIKPLNRAGYYETEGSVLELDIV